MFSPPVVSGHVLSPTRSSPATSPAALPAASSTSRGSRLRSLSYLKNYAHHLTGRDSSHSQSQSHTHNHSNSNNHSQSTSNGNSNSHSHNNTAATSAATPPAATSSAAATGPALSSHSSPLEPSPSLSPSPSSSSHQISRTLSNPLHSAPASAVQQPDLIARATSTAAAISAPGTTANTLTRTVSVPTSSGSPLQSVVESDGESPVFVSASQSPNASVATAPTMDAITEPAAAAAAASTAAPANTTADSVTTAPPAAPASEANPASHYSIRLTAYTDPRSVRQSLEFSTVLRKLPTGKEILKVGRHSERENGRAVPSNVPSAAPIGFKSKVVSRRHCEFSCDEGKWYIKDVKSSSGTFLNHVRLSSPGQESKPWRIKDGDIIQLGIDFRGGEETMFRCVKMRVEVNRGWQNSANPFNTSAHERIRNLAKTNTSSASSQDCTICLSRIAPCQTLFVAPCSHTWHYKCIKALINGPSYPLFHCPNCRATTDLEAEPEEPEGWDVADDTPPAVDETNVADATTGPEPVALGDRIDGADDTTGLTSEAATSTDGASVDPSAAAHANGDATMVVPAGALHSLHSLTLDERRFRGVQVEDPQRTAVPPLTPSAIPPSPSAVPPTPSAFPPTPGPRTPSPGSQVGHEQHILTPRNHAGPWVFDGQVLDSPQGLTPLTSALSDPGVETEMV